MLTGLQQEVRRILAGLTECKEFALGQIEAALEYFDRIPAVEFSDYTDGYDGLRNTVQATRRALAASEHPAAERKGGIGH